MNQDYEQEIDLKWILYRVLRAWRPIVVWAIIFGVVIGASSIGLWAIKCLNPEYLIAAETNFQRNHASWVATGENFKAQFSNIEEAKQEQIEYNEKSILMQIDPLREFHASFELYVNYDYQIMPNMAYQNIDLSNRILKAYATYMTNGELYQYIIDNVSYEIERRFLGEILSVSVDYSNNMISVSVRQQSAEYCQEILNLVREALMAKYDDVNATIAEHTLSSTNAAAYETVNLSLQETQKANRQAVTDLDITMQKTNEAYLEWKLEPEPQATYMLGEVLKNAIKLLIIGSIAGGVLCAVIVAFGTFMSGKLLNAKDMKNRFGLHVIGELPRKREKKPFAFFSRWFSKFGGITVVPEDYARLAKMIGSSIKSSLASSEGVESWKKIVFTGMLDEEELKNTVKALGIDGVYTCICAPDILTNAESIDKVAGADCVVLVEKQEKTLLTDVAKELEALKVWNKTVLGTVVINTDAIM